MKLLPLLIGTLISMALPWSTAARVSVGLVVYFALFFVTWKRADGSRVMPWWVW